jgi:integrase
LFLTGCRLGEAFALKFDDLKPNYLLFDESYSSEARLTKATKTNTVRIFRLKGYSKLEKLLIALKNKARSGQEYVFVTENGAQLNRYKLSAAWLGKEKGSKDNPHFQPGLVTRLVQQGKIGQYLKPSATRHTLRSILLLAIQISIALC